MSGMRTRILGSNKSTDGLRDQVGSPTRTSDKCQNSGPNENILPRVGLKQQGVQLQYWAMARSRQLWQQLLSSLPTIVGISDEDIWAQSSGMQHLRFLSSMLLRVSWPMVVETVTEMRWTLPASLQTRQEVDTSGKFSGLCTATWDVMALEEVAYDNELSNHELCYPKIKVFYTQRISTFFLSDLEHCITRLPMIPYKAFDSFDSEGAKSLMYTYNSESRPLCVRKFLFYKQSRRIFFFPSLFFKGNRTFPFFIYTLIIAPSLSSFTFPPSYTRSISRQKSDFFFSCNQVTT